LGILLFKIIFHVCPPNIIRDIQKQYIRKNQHDRIMTFCLIPLRIMTFIITLKMRDSAWWQPPLWQFKLFWVYFYWVSQLSPLHWLSLCWVSQLSPVMLIVKLLSVIMQSVIINLSVIMLSIIIMMRVIMMRVIMLRESQC
jgi:hypothetical protein